MTAPPAGPRPAAEDTAVARGGEPAPGWSRGRPLLAVAGPAFIASVAYIDPGNVVTNWMAGTERGYQLIWVAVAANVAAMLLQYLSAKTGMVTGRNLPELCAQLFTRRTNAGLWAQAELVAMATDLAEFVGASVGISILTGIGLFEAGLITAVLAVAILLLQRRGNRPLELLLAGVLLLVAVAFGYLLLATGHLDGGAAGPAGAGGSALPLAAGVIGATVMPHVVYLHSELQASRGRRTGSALRVGLRGNLVDCVVGLGLAGLVNVAMIAVAASMRGVTGPAFDGDPAEVHGVLARHVGSAAAVVFAVALVVAGLASASVGTYAGQVVMQGFLGRRIPLVVRRLVTIAPSLVVLALVDDVTGALFASQVVLCFGIPFALVPLLLVGRRADLMGAHRNGTLTTAVAGTVAVCVIAVDVFVFVEAWT